MDGSAMLVTASSDAEAVDCAEHIAKRQAFKRSTRARIAKRVECLDQEEVRK